jgi:hypothetical protein
LELAQIREKTVAERSNTLLATCFLKNLWVGLKI